MKRIMIMLLIACSAIITASAQQKGKIDNTPYNVKVLFYNFLKSWGAPSDEVYSVVKNPNTNQIESSVKITYFVANVNTGSVRQDMSAIGEAFKKDESRSYQLLHLAPTNKESFSLKVINENGQSTNYLIRAKEPEEMWLLCAKNPENPKLRDAYAIKWTYNDDRSKALGAIYQITSLRPDLYEKNMSSAGLLSENKNTFTIDGRVGYDLKDSLYVVYMADNAEELSNVKDSDFVATMPVVNKRFSYSVELDKPKVGRIRTVMPDGSLCELWTNLDFVPGETYRITTHNGYYDEDRDYEQRVGRYSGKSLLNDLQRRGIDDQTVKVTDEVPEEFVVVEDGDGVTVEPEIHLPQSAIDMQAWKNSLSPQQLIALEQKAKAMQASMKMVEGAYEVIGNVMNQGLAPKENLAYYVDLQCDEILKQNKELDKTFSDLVKAIKALNPPQSFLNDMYSQGFKEVLDVFTKQNTSFNEIYKASGSLSKKAKKTQKYINDLTEKYMQEMNQHLLKMYR